MAKINYKTVVEDLLEDDTPASWISWLFDTQNQIISTGYLAGFDKAGASDFSSRFWALKNFFEEIGNSKLIQKQHD